MADKVEYIETPISRAEVAKKDSIYREIFEAEPHHKHPVIMGPDGRPRWKANPEVRRLIDEELNLNDLWKLFFNLEYDKNSEIVRKLYREMGYSLFGYWEVFFWEANNPDAHKYKPNKK